MFTLYCVKLCIIYFLSNKAYNHLCNSDFTTYSIYNRLRFNIKHSPNLYVWYTRWSCDTLLLHKCDTNIIDIKHKRLNSQHFCSSSPLLQWRRPSHRSSNEMHWPLLHRNRPIGQVFDAERYNIMNNQWFCANLHIIIE